MKSAVRGLISRIIRSKAMLRGAEGQSCTNCGARDGTVVAAHLTGIRAAEFGKGTGIKASDIAIADLCHACHAAFDGNKMSYLKDDYLRPIDQSERMLTCVLRTIIRRVNQGILTLPDIGDKS